ncbi:MAG: hypothetical protein AAF383_25235 [Cyanobacteria bacterium P01_A01_bin.83]
MNDNIFIENKVADGKISEQISVNGVDITNSIADGEILKEISTNGVDITNSIADGEILKEISTNGVDITNSIADGEILNEISVNGVDIFTGNTVPGNTSVNRVNISGDGDSPTITISGADAQQNIKIALEEDGDEIFSFNKPQALLNIFDDQYYIDTNPDVAEAISGRYEDAGLSSELTNARFRLPSEINIVDENGIAVDVEPRNIRVAQYVASIEHYLNSGAVEGRDPSPLFDSEYYLGQNPDVATALAGGSFEGDPLLHYVSVGALEGRDPNAYFDTDYYIEQNFNTSEISINPLEHYVSIGSFLGADPSPNFDTSFYLDNNPDVAAAGVDPLAHYLTVGQQEGRLPTA